MNKLYFPNFNIHTTLLGGQSFSWDFVNGFYIGVTQDRGLKVRYENDILYWQTYPDPDDIVFINRYFKIGDTHYDASLGEIIKDKYVAKAVNSKPGIRLLQQDLEHTLLSFIVSSNNSIKSIKTRIRNLNSTLGKKIDIDGYKTYTFPKTSELASSDEVFLRDLGLGYRAKYVKEAAKMLEIEGKSRRMEGANYTEDQTNDWLLSFPGVGQKVADCVHIFALGNNNLMPIDRWTARIMHDLYGLSEETNHKDMRKWIQNNFNGYASLAGQFLFEWYRELQTDSRS